MSERRMSDGFDRCAGDVIRPAQFHGLWKGSPRWSPAQKIACAVLEQAMEDLGRDRRCATAVGERLFRQAHAWIESYDRSHMFSFVNVCETLNLSSDAVRERLIGLMRNATVRDEGEAYEGEAYDGVDVSKASGM